jgi:vesicular inhibitory amino acid transporter
MDNRGKQPSAWSAYDSNRPSIDSDTESHVQWDELSRRPSGESNAGRWTGTAGELRRRR